MLSSLSTFTQFSSINTSHTQNLHKISLKYGLGTERRSSFLIYLAFDFPRITPVVLRTAYVYVTKTKVISFGAARLSPSVVYSSQCSALSRAAEEILVT